MAVCGANGPGSSSGTMKPPPFSYFRPAGREETLGLLREHGDEAKVLAGGQSLIPMMNLRLAAPAILVDIGGLDELTSISSSAHGTLAIGATTRQAAVLRSPEVASLAPMVTEALRWISHPAVRERGTFGGSIAHNHPAAELPAVLVALEAEVVVESRSGPRTIPAAELFVSYMTTALEDDELLTEIRIPPPPEGRCLDRFREVARRHGDFAIAGAAVRLVVDGDDAITAARIVLCGVSDSPVRITAAESALVGMRIGDDDATRHAAELAGSDLDPFSDIHASGAYRRRVSVELVRQAITDHFSGDGNLHG